MSKCTKQIKLEINVARHQRLQFDGIYDQLQTMGKNTSQESHLPLKTTIIKHQKQMSLLCTVKQLFKHWPRGRVCNKAESKNRKFLNQGHLKHEMHYQRSANVSYFCKHNIGEPRSKKVQTNNCLQSKYKKKYCTLYILEAYLNIISR